MVVPVPVIMVLCLITFVLTYFQYYKQMRNRRMVDLRFLVMLASAMCALAYPVAYAFLQTRPTFPRVSLGFLAGGLGLLLASVLLLIRLRRPTEKS